MPKKKLICPKCGSVNAAMIVYGLPSHEAFEAEQRGEIILGGCCINPDSPRYSCRDCSYDWGSYSGLEIIPLMQTLKAHIGGFWGPNCDIEIDIKAGKVKYRFTNLDEPDKCIEFEKGITIEEWQKFIKGLQNCDIEYWLDSYDNPHVCDGTQWSVEITTEHGQTIEKHGSNMYPGKWKQFCRLLTKFSGGKFV